MTEKSSDRVLVLGRLPEVLLLHVVTVEILARILLLKLLHLELVCHRGPETLHARAGAG
jgi:hypothetical protein